MLFYNTTPLLTFLVLKDFFLIVLLFHLPYTLSCFLYPILQLFLLDILLSSFPPKLFLIFFILRVVVLFIFSIFSPAFPNTSYHTLVMNRLDPIEELYNMYSEEEDTPRIVEVEDDDLDFVSDIEGPADPYMDL